MLVALSIIFVFCIIAVLFISAPIRISGMVSGDLYNGGAGLDVKLLPLWGAFGAGVLRPEGGEFRVWLYVFGRQLLRIPIPREKSDEKQGDTNEVSADFKIGETIEPIDLKDFKVYTDYTDDKRREVQSDSEQPFKYVDDTQDNKSRDNSKSDSSKKDEDFKEPRKPLRERIRNFIANAKKYIEWVKTGLGDLWYIIRIELLAGHVTVGLVNHPATIGSIMGGFMALNGLLPRPFRISVQSVFTRTVLEGRIEVELTVYLHRFWITLFRRRKVILDIWREYRQSQTKEAEVLSVDNNEKDDVQADEPVHAM